MKSRDFVYWLQGYFEIHAPQPTKKSPVALSHAQVTVIKKHLAMVFKHEIDPSAGDEAHQNELNEIHNAFPPGGIIRC